MRRVDVLGLAVVLAALFACRGKPKNETQPAATAAPVVASTQPAELVKESPITVDMKELLSEYKDNEVRADAKFKDKLIVVGGAVREVKKDILDHVYVKVGDHERTGTQALVEIPAVQCFPKDDQIAKAASLSKGDLVAVRGHVEGLMMNVLIKDCEIKTKADLKDKP